MSKMPQSQSTGELEIALSLKEPEPCCSSGQSNDQLLKVKTFQKNWGVIHPEQTEDFFGLVGCFDCFP